MIMAIIIQYSLSLLLYVISNCDVELCGYGKVLVNCDNIMNICILHFLGIHIFRPTATIQIYMAWLFPDMQMIYGNPLVLKLFI
jgi:hypothetical protein